MGWVWYGLGLVWVWVWVWYGLDLVWLGLLDLQILIFLPDGILLLLQTLINSLTPSLGVQKKRVPVSFSGVSTCCQGLLNFFAVFLLQNSAKHGLRNLKVGQKIC